MSIETQPSPGPEDSRTTNVDPNPSNSSTDMDTISGKLTIKASKPEEERSISFKDMLLGRKPAVASDKEGGISPKAKCRMLVSRLDNLNKIVTDRLSPSRPNVPSPEEKVIREISSEDAQSSPEEISTEAQQADSSTFQEKNTAEAGVKKGFLEVTRKFSKPNSPSIEASKAADESKPIKEEEKAPQKQGDERTGSTADEVQAAPQSATPINQAPPSQSRLTKIKRRVSSITHPTPRKGTKPEAPLEEEVEQPDQGPPATGDDSAAPKEPQTAEEELQEPLTEGDTKEEADKTQAERSRAWLPSVSGLKRALTQRVLSHGHTPHEVEELGIEERRAEINTSEPIHEGGKSKHERHKSLGLVVAGLKRAFTLPLNPKTSSTDEKAQVESRLSPSAKPAEPGAGASEIPTAEQQAEDDSTAKADSPRTDPIKGELQKDSTRIPIKLISGSFFLHRRKQCSTEAVASPSAGEKGASEHSAALSASVTEEVKAEPQEKPTASSLNESAFSGLKKKLSRAMVRKKSKSDAGNERASAEGNSESEDKKAINVNPENEESSESRAEKTEGDLAQAGDPREVPEESSKVEEGVGKTPSTITKTPPTGSADSPAEAPEVRSDPDAAGKEVQRAVPVDQK
ncbi:hypothetical protein IE53DRAFT_154788 [Violaceomyces palustris]|uniref:Uncharacterized protein n=1 Tax=Violaceomyces palustris TaxID=1673888 RepID=A0ACD0NU16_9BASI|nr:hypothetical protein IE53DRAFT_154788 [Violaceomyces palustris]